MSDSIDRNAAINALNMLFKKRVTQFGYEGYEKADEKTQLVCDGISYSIECVMNLPSEQSQRWIPVSERLPENGHYYLWCSNGGNVQSDYYWDGFENGQKYGYTIVAWMPLPESYKGGEE